ncbi:MAG: hypothetical protein PVI66_00335, partial [Candidatus Aminicenantes bacterium]
GRQALLGLSCLFKIEHLISPTYEYTQKRQIVKQSFSILIFIRAYKYKALLSAPIPMGYNPTKGAMRAWLSFE